MSDAVYVGHYCARRSDAAGTVVGSVHLGSAKTASRHEIQEDVD